MHPIIIMEKKIYLKKFLFLILTPSISFSLPQYVLFHFVSFFAYNILYVFFSHIFVRMITSLYKFKCRLILFRNCLSLFESTTTTTKIFLGKMYVTCFCFVVGVDVDDVICAFFFIFIVVAFHFKFHAMNASLYRRKKYKKKFH